MEEEKKSFSSRISTTFIASAHRSVHNGPESTGEE